MRGGLGSALEASVLNWQHMDVPNYSLDAHSSLLMCGRSLIMHPSEHL